MGEKEIQDFVEVMRKSPPESKELTLQTTNMVLELQRAVDIFGKDPSKKPTKEEMKRFFLSCLISELILMI